MWAIASVVGPAKGILVRLLKGQRWQCESRYCGCEIEVLASSEVEEGMNPRCSCGTMMKKAYVQLEVKPCDPAVARPMVNRKAAGKTK